MNESTNGQSTNGRGTENIEKLNRRYFAKFCHFLQLGIRDMLNFHVEKQAVKKVVTNEK